MISFILIYYRNYSVKEYPVRTSVNMDYKLNYKFISHKNRLKHILFKNCVEKYRYIV